MIDVDLVDSLGAIDAEDFDRLDDSAGAAGSYWRLRALESDRRWTVRYVVARHGDGVVAVLPVYRSRQLSVSDSAYDPVQWGAQLRSSPRQRLLVAGRADSRSCLHLSPGALLEEGLTPLLSAVAGLAEPDWDIVFPFLYDDDRNRLAAVLPSMAWFALGEEAFFDGPLPGRDLTEVRSRVRTTLRRDRAATDRYKISTEVVPWDQCPPDAAELIAGHNERMGSADHAEFVQARMHDWNVSPDTAVVVFRGRAGGLTGVLTAIVWRDRLELAEIGLPGEPCPERSALYVELLFHASVRFANAHGLRSIRAGLAARTPKAVRGARFRSLHGAVISAGRLTAMLPA